jgi:hypothetical protein
MGRSSLTHLALVLTLCLAHTLATSIIEPGYRTCELHSLTHLRSFESSATTVTPIEACLQSGSRVLVHNQWLKVVLHSYLNETTFTKGVEWRSTKIFIEFYGDLAGVPIALVSSETLLCDCTLKCAIDNYIREIGVDGVLSVTFKHDTVLGNALYVEYPRAGISLYIRKLKTGFNFGIRMPEQASVTTQGMCQSGCPIKIDLLSNPCFDMVRGRQVCEAAFTGLQMDDDRYVACIHDIFLWRDVRVAIGHRLAALDLALIRQYSLIDALYPSLFSMDYTPIGTYQSIVEGSRCVETLFRRVDITSGGSRDETVMQAYAQPLLVESVPVSEPTTRKIVVELPQSGYGSAQHEETVVDGIERSDLAHFCVKHRTIAGIYYLMMPQMKTHYIQCTETNRAFLRSCPTGTVFTVRMTCERVVESVTGSTGYGTVSPSMDVPVFTPPVVVPTYGSKVQQDVTVVPTIPVVSTPEAVESIEFRKECETRRLTHQGVFFFPVPDNRNSYIQCDESNRAFIRTCPIGTVFTENLACERIGEEIQRVESVVKPVVQLDTFVPLVASYGAAPVQREEVVTAIKVAEIIPVEAPEYNALCQSQRLTKVGLFYVSFPSNRSMFIQCDESNRAFVKTCPLGTIFTELLTCERIEEVRPVEAVVPVVPLVPTPISYGHVEVSKPVVVETHTMPAYNSLPVVPLPVQLDTASSVVLSSPEAVESPEFKKECETKRLTSKGLFYIAHPTSRTQYIQCDESNRAFVRTCPIGTVFTENLACERIGEEIQRVETVVKPVVQLDAAAIKTGYGSVPQQDVFVAPKVEVPLPVVPVGEQSVAESVEFRKECETRRLTHQGVFFIAMPTSRSQYIQCDELNRAFVRTCPVGTVFTENLACERIGEQVKSVVVEQVRPIVTVVQDVKTPVVEVVPVIPTYNARVQQDVVVAEKVVDLPKVVEVVTMPAHLSSVETVVESASVESVEYRRECESKRTTLKGVFFIPLPTNRSQYIQCDEVNRAFIRTCPLGTVFTDNLACERIGQEIRVEQLVVKPVVEHEVPVVATTGAESNSYLNSIVSGIKKIFPTISRDEVPRKQADFMVEDRPLLLQRVPTGILADESTVPNPCSDEMRKLKRFFFIHPTNANKYIQCDESNRMTIKTCFKNTVFSEEKQTCI